MHSTTILIVLALAAPSAQAALPPCPPTPTPISADLGVPQSGPRPHPEPRQFVRAKLLRHAPVRFGTIQGNVPADLVVIVEVVVSSFGCVLGTRILRGASPQVDAVVLEASRDLRFTPAMADHQPVATYVTLSFACSTRRFSQVQSQQAHILWPD